MRYLHNFFFLKILFFFGIGNLSSLAFNSNIIFLPLMIISVVSIFYFIYNNNLTIFRVFLIGCSYSFGQLFLGLYWISFAFEFTVSLGIWVGIIAVLCLAIVLSIFTGIFCALSKYLKDLWRLNVYGYALHQLGLTKYFG